MSAQAQVRAAAKPLLLAASGLQETAYFPSPRRNLSPAELPALCVYSHGDRPADADADATQCHERVYTLRVEVRVADRPEDDATDALAAAVRRALLTDDSLGLPFVRRITWIDQQWDGAEEESPLAGTALDFNVHYLWSPE